MSSEVVLKMQGGRWKRYPAYRDSGVEWLGEVPERWVTWKITHGFQQVGSGTTPKSDDMQYYNGEIPWVTTSELRETVITYTKSKLTEKALKNYSSLHIYPPETLLFAMYGATIGRMGLLKIHATVNQACCAFTDSKFLDPKFTFYWLWMRRPILITLSVGGGQPNLSQDDLRNIRIPAPPIPEQRAIAAFLDRETGRIDTLIEKKERQIELLQEKRAALISHAVTKGLDPDVKMKDSGVEWLGDVPEGWDVRKLKHIASVKFSSVDKKTEEDEQPICLCNYVDVYYNDYITSDLDLMKATASVTEIQNFTLRGGDILITKDSESWDDIAVPAYVSSDINNVLCGYHLAQIRPNISLSDGEYLFRSFYARGINNQFRVAATGVTRYGLGKYWLDNSLFLVPPLPEQRAIAAFLDRETGRIDTLTTKLRESTSKLREYRIALISAAVTGKIDVRQEAA